MSKICQITGKKAMIGNNVEIISIDGKSARTIKGKYINEYIMKET